MVLSCAVFCSEICRHVLVGYGDYAGKIYCVLWGEFGSFDFVHFSADIVDETV